MKIVVILHLFYQDLWPEFKSYLSNIKEPFDLYVTLCSEHEDVVSSSIIATYPSASIIKTENRGADVYPFFLVFSKILESGKDYDFLLKIHSKKILRKEKLRPGFGKEKRLKTILPLVGSVDIVNRNLKNLSIPSVGIIGAKSTFVYASAGSNDRLVNEGKVYIDQMMKWFELPATDKSYFLGTMFWCKFQPLKKYLSKHNIPRDFFEAGEHSKGGTAAHAGERMFCKFFLAEKLRIVLCES